MGIEHLNELGLISDKDLQAFSHLPQQTVKEEWTRAISRMEKSEVQHKAQWNQTLADNYWEAAFRQAQDTGGKRNIDTTTIALQNQANQSSAPIIVAPSTLQDTTGYVITGGKQKIVREVCKTQCQHSPGGSLASPKCVEEICKEDFL